ncbi:polysaccharide deacetylase family protein [Paenibacillus hexagrammi]|uniref:Polysaccharide deacetylase family protein n=1 Tax=Paenibacillus hexagrammi TaxID=2908839 RepID=A0ABY3SCM0_9BACL|nr:polysaccharide deacetylase family protein [Paenibacillus sp. YPD9-1]UJF31168.1 polysaccharide deacetylase family protein [Paenibacillus sp. YPD9-1]
MKRTLTIWSAGICILIAGCSQGNSIPSVSETAAATPSPAPAAVPTATPTPIPTATPAPTPIEVKKEYHMNKNYDIVPNDPAGNKKVVLLTFDDGPKEKEMNEALVKTLDKHKAKAIFFMNGYRIKQKPELVTFIHNSGNYIGNHSWDHIHLNEQTNEKIDQQIDDVQRIVKGIIGQTPQYFRPPNGLGNDYLKNKIKNEGMLYMTWSNGSLDWEMTTKKNDPNKVIDNVMKQLHFGSNILMHELPWTVEALDPLLTKLEEKGYSFVDPGSIELEMR